MNARAGFASFEDRLTMVIAGEFLKGAVDDQNNGGNPITGTTYGSSVMVLVEGVVQARQKSHWNRFGEVLERAQAELRPFLEDPRNAIPYMAYFANQFANLEECLPALLVAQSISDHMARQTQVSMTREIIEKVLKDMQTAAQVNARRIAATDKGSDEPT